MVVPSPHPWQQPRPQPYPYHWPHPILPPMPQPYPGGAPPAGVGGAPPAGVGGAGAAAAKAPRKKRVVNYTPENLEYLAHAHVAVEIARADRPANNKMHSAEIVGM